MIAIVFVLLLEVLAGAQGLPNYKVPQEPLGTSSPRNLRPAPCDLEPAQCNWHFTPFVETTGAVIESRQTNFQILEDAFDAFAVLQDQYFDPDIGTWPSSIDWTGAVVGAIYSGMLTTLTSSLEFLPHNVSGELKAKENLISSLFSDIVRYYFGQDALAIRGQAYDDILWVVLGWMDAIRFVRSHEDLYSMEGKAEGHLNKGLRDALDSVPWHGHSWVRSFAHRARIFWHLGRKGWDTRLCGGGMVWNPRLRPYKNAITNELWISASIAMYQHFPGDNFTAPWRTRTTTSEDFPRRDPVHLAAAVEGYRWLMDVGMVNDQGLFADGFHVDPRKPGNVECDVRDEMVYTYNQGVILTGQRGLWDVTGSVSYLRDGHRLIQSVLGATGWDLSKSAPADDRTRLAKEHLPPWHGLGRGGILEEQCDASGTCSQDAQTFKGIFFHHLAGFCAPLELPGVGEGVKVDAESYRPISAAHLEACRSYLGWVRHNANAALQTRDERGRFGMWWGAGHFGNVTASLANDGIEHAAANVTDYRNSGTPQDSIWGLRGHWQPGGKVQEGWLRQQDDSAMVSDAIQSSEFGQQRPLARLATAGRTGEPGIAVEAKDPNARGRGRTVETQAGGLALLRAYWDMSQL